MLRSRHTTLPRRSMTTVKAHAAEDSTLAAYASRLLRFYHLQRRWGGDASPLGLGGGCGWVQGYRQRSAAAAKQLLSCGAGRAAPCKASIALTLAPCTAAARREAVAYALYMTTNTFLSAAVVAATLFYVSLGSMGRMQLACPCLPTHWPKPGPLALCYSLA